MNMQNQYTHKLQRNMLYRIVILFLFCGSILCQDEEPEECSKIISRQQWGARRAEIVTYAIFPVNTTIIHHTASDECSTQVRCVEHVRNIQSYHVDELLYGDIGYNFLIGGDGNIYEGVGWHKVGSHTFGYNSISVGIAFIGNYNRRLPKDTQMKALETLLECGVKLHELTPDYKLLAGRQVIATSSPGLELYKKLQDWPHFSAIVQ